MKLHQLSVFLENRAGKLRMPCRILAEAGVDIKTLTLADTQQFGILRLIVNDWQKAKGALESGGFIVNDTEVVAIEVPDRPGGLDSILAVIEDAGTNVEYMYAFTFGRDGQAVLIFRFEDTDVAVAALRAHGINIIDVFGDL
ncbi:MAG: ACT domain-containing protein [Candidatus Sumerlaeia bacterium]